MANRILTTEGWENRVRAKLGTESAYLPDADLQMPEVILVAEANIIKTVPDYATLADDDLIYLEAATICECAILACSSMPARLPKKEQGPSFTVELDIDWNSKQTKLEAERDGFISNISTVTYNDVPHFGLC